MQNVFEGEGGPDQPNPPHSGAPAVILAYIGTLNQPLPSGFTGAGAGVGASVVVDGGGGVGTENGYKILRKRYMQLAGLKRRYVHENLSTFRQIQINFELIKIALYLGEIWKIGNCTLQT